MSHKSLREKQGLLLSPEPFALSFKFLISVIQLGRSLGAVRCVSVYVCVCVYLFWGDPELITFLSSVSFHPSSGLGSVSLRLQLQVLLRPTERVHPPVPLLPRICYWVRKLSTPLLSNRLHSAFVVPGVSDQAQGGFAPNPLSQRILKTHYSPKQDIVRPLYNQVWYEGVRVERRAGIGREWENNKPPLYRDTKCGCFSTKRIMH